MKKLDIIYEDKELLVVNKPTKKLTIATEKNKFNTLYHEVRQYIKKQNPKNKIFIVHRLDEQTSGIVLFAKNEKLKYLLQKNWQNYYREYIAIVEGKLTGIGTIKSYLKESKTLQVYSTNDSKFGKLAITNYESLKSNKNYSVVKINIETGRKNQIRVHLSDLGYPIVGDKKYNAKTNILNRLGLHANKLEITHPISKKKFIFEAKLPKVMTNLNNFD
ncbi:MAG: RNA pseudouridine synthase [Bacilli bacterium]|nr:RNA pseudouridine synthase [Bacilli bacterium]